MKSSDSDPAPGFDPRFDNDLRWATWAVARWAGFPVDHVPRPVVLVSEAVEVDGTFASDEAQRAFSLGRFRAEVPIPTAIMERLHVDASVQSGRDVPSPVSILAAERSETEFFTDRGPRVLPAWRLSGDAVEGQIWVLDGEAACAWAPSDLPTASPPVQPASSVREHWAQVVVDSDGRTLTYPFAGGPTGFEHYPQAEVVESNHAVSIVPKRVQLDPTGARRTRAYAHSVTVTLDRPLGARAFVDLHGRAGEVTSAA